MRQITSAAGALCSITLAAGSAGQRVCLQGVAWSYSAAPTGGRLTIASTGQPTFDVDTPAVGLNQLDPTQTFRGQPGQTVVVTLAAPGGAVIGKLNVLNDWLE
jgi:hypothetical protein